MRISTRYACCKDRFYLTCGVRSTRRATTPERSYKLLLDLEQKLDPDSCACERAASNRRVAMATTDAELLKPELVFFDVEAKGRL